MKTFSRILFCFLCLAVSKATAQETFAPLLTENTLVFIHVDFSKVDIDTLKAEITKASETLLQNLGFDARSQRATLRDLELELEKLDEMVRPAWETITKEFGIQEVAAVMDDWLPDRLPFRGWVIPWKERTEQDLQKLFSILPDPEINAYENDFFSIGDFLFITDDPVNPFEEPLDFDSRKQFIADWVKTVAASKDSPVLRALQSLNKSDEIKAVFMVTKLFKMEVYKMEDILDSLPPDTPIQIQKLVEFAEKIEWIAASLPVSEILSGTIESNRQWVTAKLPNAADARKLRELMVDAIDAGVPIPDDIPPLVVEFMKGYLRTFLPDVEEDKLIFRLKGSNKARTILGTLGGGSDAFIPVSGQNIP